MKSLALILGLLAAVQAYPGVVTPMYREMPVIEGAPELPPTKIIGGTQATLGQFPHQVAILIGGSTFCGGSLISPLWVLTAAHCTPATTFQVMLGRVQWQNANQGVQVTTTTRINHSGYNPSNLNNDISLIRFNSAVTLTNNIRPVNLAPANSGTFAGVTATASGWGRTTQTGGVSPNLMWVNLAVITNAVCAQTFGSTIIASTICTNGGSGRGTCSGDSGGSLAIQQNGAWTLIGVVSFVAANNCGGVHPEGYARVSSFRAWIQTNSGV